MLFDNFFSSFNNINTGSIDVKTISIYPIGDNNLEGIKVLIDNCLRMGAQNSNVKMATVDPSLWLGGFLDKHWTKISYVSTLPSFHILKIEDNKIISKQYITQTQEFESVDSIDDFFMKNNWRRFVLFSIVKYVDLSNLSVSFRLRYADITEKYEERDNKLEEILK